ncbi:MAG: hypothetical protein V8Q37_03340 [Angelakisella sp.]|jgi:23S rRNA pseudoU1915 N3-methylase RlmH
MLKIQVIAIGKVKEDWMRQGIAEALGQPPLRCRQPSVSPYGTPVSP